jgi:nucleoside-diphosphate-sugar epimerase
MRDLIAVRNSKLKHIVFVSTVCALGGPLADHPARSSTECRPVSEYGRKKKEIEQMIRDLNQSGAVAGTNFRPSSTDGPGAWLSGNLWCRDGAFFGLLKAKRPIIVCAGDVLCHHGSTRDVGRAVAFSAGRQVCFGKTYQAVGDECITQAEWTRRSAAAIGINDPNIVEIDANWLCQKLANWKAVGFLSTIWRYHGTFDTTELKKDIPEWRPELTIADNSRLTWEWGVQSGKWDQAKNMTMEIPPEPLCEAYSRAKSQFIG